MNWPDGTIIGVCRLCGSDVMSRPAGSEVIADRPEAAEDDFWAVCANETCSNRHGEGWCMDRPSWVVSARVHADAELMKVTRELNKRLIDRTSAYESRMAEQGRLLNAEIRLGRDLLKVCRSLSSDVTALRAILEAETGTAVTIGDKSMEALAVIMKTTEDNSHD